MTEQDKPWYKHPWVWFIIALPATAVVAGITTVVIATKGRDPLVGEYYKFAMPLHEMAAPAQATLVIQAEQATVQVTVPDYTDKGPGTLRLQTAGDPVRQVTLHRDEQGVYRAGFPTPAGNTALVLLADGADWQLQGVWQPDTRELVLKPVAR